MDRICIGLLGYGAIGKVHTLCYRELPLLYPGKLPELKLVGVCTGRPETALTAARDGGYQLGYTELSKLLANDEINVVDCSLPNHLHRHALLQAIQAGKHVYCEKPLALNAAEAREIAGAARKAGVHLGMTFNFRFVPALMQARRLIEQGAIGNVYGFRGEYLHSGYQDPTRPLSWRTRKSMSGGGALVDLGTHVIDLIRYLLGEYESVRALVHTYVTDRPMEKGSQQKGPVDVDDAAWLQVRLRNGGIGTIEVSRFATGTLDDLNLTVHGEKGAFRFQLMDANFLYWFDETQPGGAFGGQRGWKRLETVQHYPGSNLPPPRSILGWTRTHAENLYTFLRAVAEGATPIPNATDGLRAQLILEAAYRSAENSDWQNVEQD